MGISAYLVCPSRQLIINLGKPLRRPDGTVVGFDQGVLSDARRAAGPGVVEVPGQHRR
jgi:hypothetical protein